MSEEYALLAKHIDPFEDLKHAEELLEKYKPTGNEDVYEQKVLTI